MEPGIREFLKRIIKCMSMFLLWMLVNATAGIKYNLGFPDGPLKTANIIFYIWAIGSLAFVVWYIVRLWKKPFIIEE